MSPRWTVVIPTIGRASLTGTLTTLAADVVAGARDLRSGPVDVVLVDDRPLDAPPLELPDTAPGALAVRVLRSGGRGPAAARNVGWRSARSEWVAFLDDDVLVPAGWCAALERDLDVPDDVGAVQGRIHVPLPEHRPPTDWERNTVGLERAVWATADMAYRRTALAAVGGMDERFPRAYREDTDLALRVQRAGWRVVVGARTITHPVRPADALVSVRMQAGAASDALMRVLHGPGWRALGGTGRGRFPWHVATVLAAGVAVGAAARRRVVGRRRLAGLAAGTWAGLTADFARRRIAPGPRPGDDGWAVEWRRMAWTSVLIPPAAVWHRVVGTWRARGTPSWPPPLRAVLLDRDGTLVEDVPYNGDPAKVRPMPGAREAVAALRAAGLRVGVVTNQSGIARGLLTPDDVAAVHARVDELLGPFDVWEHCPHGPDSGCTCRKPAPGMVLAAARRLGVAPHECAVVGDIGADVGAAVAAGALAVLVPTPVTRPEEVADAERAELVAPDLRTAVDLLLSGPARGDVRPATERWAAAAADGEGVR